MVPAGLEAPGDEGSVVDGVATRTDGEAVVVIVGWEGGTVVTVTVSAGSPQREDDGIVVGVAAVGGGEAVHTGRRREE